MITNLQSMIRTRVLIVMIAAAAAVSGCVTNPATGEKEFSLMSVAQEAQLGAQADQQIVAEYGLYGDQALADYVNTLGKKIEAKADKTSFTFTYRLLDSPVINAFALPGGYVYVTRGLLSHIQNEAQLAVVMGHEIGHVTARHAAKTYTQSQIANLGLGLGAVLFEGLRPFLGAAQTGLQLLFLKFSREHELQSDELGVKYATLAGYDAKEGAGFFAVLERLGNEAALQNGGKLPTWQSTHPDPGDRKVRIVQLAATNAAQFAPTGGLTGANPAEFLPKLENMVFGPDPQAGFVENGIFNLPSLRVRFSVPSGWQLANFASAVQYAPSDGKAVAEMSTGSGTTPDGAATAFLSGTGATATSRTQANVNGMTATRLQSTLNVDNGNGGATPLTILSYFIAKDNLIYVFHGYALAADFPSYATNLENSFKSFSPLTDASIINVVPYKVDVFNAPQTGTFASMVAAPGAKRGTGITVTVHELAIMNQTEETATIPAGTPLKRIQ